MKKLLAILSIVLLAGCGNKIMTRPVGEVKEVTDKTVTVYYEVVTRNFGDRVGNTYYFEDGHSYKVGDPFPKVEP
ncbi:hypothetical protein KIH41_01310 [Litoribacter ruber]|uniref:Uncharacterized protein n=1 Tax=Litoribacter ruber TaxID=702568 RepID=A0AAP2CIH6_9BACT|nr:MULTISPECIES: hypothetical protein [Litoribacter]MBS9524289.1 hypothetical protein [Litoribacter alkaliphilus]MBT0809913.1 hypothetical protein [Litoribacter ruber]